MIMILTIWKSRLLKIYKKLRERKMGKEEFKDIPDDIKKRIIMMGILAGKDLTVVHQRITFNDSKIENSISVNRELADLLNIEPDIQ